MFNVFDPILKNLKGLVMKGDTEFGLMVVFFFLGCIFMFYAQNITINELYLASFYTVIGTLFAAFFGAWSAYKLQLKAAEKELKQKDVISGSLALIKLDEVLCSFIGIKNDLVSKIKDNDTTSCVELTFSDCFEIRPVILSSMSKINIDSLAFLLASDCNRDLLANILEFQSNVVSAEDNIKKRAKIFHDEVQVFVADLKEKEKTLTINQVEKKIEERLKQRFLKSTDLAFETIEIVINDSIDLLNDLEKAINDVYPDTVKKISEPERDGTIYKVKPSCYRV